MRAQGGRGTEKATPQGAEAPAGRHGQVTREGNVTDGSDDPRLARLVTLRRRRLRMWLAFWSLWPVCLVAHQLWGEQAVRSAAAVWGGLTSILALFVSASRCPRCGRLFHMAFPIASIWTRRCMHCRLSLFEDERVKDLGAERRRL